MSQSLAWTITAALQGYAACGLVFALIFVPRGLGALDPAARSGGVGLRLILFPGCALLWPYLAWRWIRRPEPPAALESHRHMSKKP